MVKKHRIAANFQVTFYTQFGRKNTQEMIALRKRNYAQLMSNVPAMGEKLIVNVKGGGFETQLIVADEVRLDQATRRRLSLQRIEDWAKEGTVRIQCALLHSL